MTEQEINLINKLETNIGRLIDKLEAKQNELSKLQSDYQALKSNYSEKEDELQEVQKRFENLKVAKALIEGETGTKEAKLKINKIVREIDTCIALLNS